MPPPLPRQSKVSISREEEHRIRDRTVRFEPLCILVSPEAQGFRFTRIQTESMGYV